MIVLSLLVKRGVSLANKEGTVRLNKTWDGTRCINHIIKAINMDPEDPDQQIKEGKSALHEPII